MKTDSDPIEPFELLTCEQVATRLGTTVGQVYNMVNRGQLIAAVRIPGIGPRWSALGFETWLRGKFSPPHSGGTQTPVRAPRHKPKVIPAVVAVEAPSSKEPVA